MAQKTTTAATDPTMTAAAAAPRAPSHDAPSPPRSDRRPPRPAPPDPPPAAQAAALAAYAHALLSAAREVAHTRGPLARHATERVHRHPTGRGRGTNTEAGVAKKGRRRTADARRLREVGPGEPRRQVRRVQMRQMRLRADGGEGRG